MLKQIGAGVISLLLLTTTMVAGTATAAGADHTLPNGQTGTHEGTTVCGTAANNGNNGCRSPYDADPNPGQSSQRPGQTPEEQHREQRQTFDYICAATSFITGVVSIPAGGALGGGCVWMSHQ